MNFDGDITSAAIILFVIKELFVLIREMVSGKKNDTDDRKDSCPYVYDRSFILERLKELKK
ncbi:MAG: hypothetical protein P8184_16490 [Calditrichia bacterium]